MQHIEKILTEMYEEINDSAAFIPLVIANAIVCYKLSHEDEIYWLNFSKKANSVEIKTLKDLYLFFIDFLPQTSQFESSYQRKINHLKEFDSFLGEFFYKQKYYYKNPDDFKKHLGKCIKGMPNPKVLDFAYEIFVISAKIRFEK